MLVNERNKWRDAFARGAKVGMPYLDEYRANRDSESFRMGKGVEVLCERILYLEELLRELEESK